MILELVCIIVGIMVGYTWAMESQSAEYKKTLEQVDAKIREDLEFHKNLNQSLKQDVQFLRDKIKRTSENNLK